MFINVFLICCISSLSLATEDVDWNEHLQLQSFSWSSCSSTSDAESVDLPSVAIDWLSIAPDPVVVPGWVSAGTRFRVNQTLESPLHLSISIKKRVFYIWVKIPCEHQLGSCDFADACSLVSRFECPAAFKHYGLPCQCPVTAGHYNLPMSPVYQVDKSLPSWLESGDYQVTVSVRDKLDNQVFCLFMTLSVVSRWSSNHV